VGDLMLKRDMYNILESFSWAGRAEVNLGLLEICSVSYNLCFCFDYL
jgi:hypothetical protein